MTTIGIQRLINHHIKEAWRARQYARTMPLIREWCRGQYVAHRNTLEYLRSL